MDEAPTKVFLIAGTPSCGKTSLARRISEGLWAERAKPTIGLDQGVGTLHVAPDPTRLRKDLEALMPASGIEVKLWEIGGKDGHLRSVPRGQTIDGIILCYDVGNRSSFQTAAHILLKHRTDRHFAHDRPAVVAETQSAARLVAVLCGTKADEADESEGHAVSTADQLDFVERSGLSGAFVTSAKTGEGVDAALQALLLASLEAEEEAEAGRVVVANQPPAYATWSLASPGIPSGGDCSRDLAAMSSPRGARPHEPARGLPAAPVVEILDHQGTPYGTRALASCLQTGLLHRVVHVWLIDSRCGGLLLRRYSPLAAKEPSQWGPSARGEVLSYRRDGIAQGPQSAELATDAARRVLREQLGFQTPAGLDHWTSCTSRQGSSNELLEIYTVDIGDTGLSNLELRKDEAIEWVHFTDVFGSVGMGTNELFYIDDQYRTAMVQKMRVRVEHAHSGNGQPLVGLARGRPQCPLPIVASKHLDTRLA